jgi:hypothetical protein
MMDQSLAREICIRSEFKGAALRRLERSLHDVVITVNGGHNIP